MGSFEVEAQESCSDCLLACSPARTFALLQARSRSRACASLPARSTPIPSTGSAPVASSSVDDFKTVRVYKTTKVLPGTLVVLETGQETDTIYLSDQSGRDEIEIGRDSPDIAGGIRIKDKTNTLSRRQARILYSTSDKQFKLLNLAGEASNPTMINEREMSGNETVVLNDNDVLRMGNVELKFKKP